MLKTKAGFCLQDSKQSFRELLFSAFFSGQLYEVAKIQKTSTKLCVSASLRLKHGHYCVVYLGNHCVKKGEVEAIPCIYYNLSIHYDSKSL